jgi:hypothetical protein
MPQLKIKLRDDADEAILAQARLGAERWVDEGGSFRAEAEPSAPTGGELKNVTATRPAVRYRLPGKN